MRHNSKQFAAIALALLLAGAHLSQPVAAVASKKSKRPAAAKTQDDNPSPCVENRDHDPEQCIEDRDAGQNGITVGQPKVYDDALLQQMLRAAEARLAALQVFDQAAILARLGAVTGASQQFSSFGVNVQTAPTAGVSTVAGADAETVTTTQSSFTPPTAPAPPPTQTFPTGFSVSSSDILNEQTQLSAEINGLRLLLAGSLSDHYIRNDKLGLEMTKFKTTLGFPITISTPRRYKDAVAVVEVEVLPEQNLSSPPELPAVTAIIPREKTYNVASITDRSTSIGGGVATQILGFSGSWVRGHKTYYLVQDQDTVALTYNPANGDRTGFRWQFRPVLGQQFVRSGLKQTFVQLAFPALPNARAGQIGRVIVKTYWRKYNRKTGVVGDLIGGSYRRVSPDFNIPSYRLVVEPGFFSGADHVEDLGGGQLLLRVEGRFLPGTSVRIGSTLLSEGPRFKHDHQGIRFIASTSDLVSKRVALVAHDGTEVPLLLDTANCQGLSVDSPIITPVDETNSRVMVRVSPDTIATQETLPLVFVLGTRVFGYSDAPIRRERKNDVEVTNEKGEKVKVEGVFLSALVPNSVLNANPVMKVQTILTPVGAKGCFASVPLRNTSPNNQTVRLVLLEQQGDRIKFLAFGNGLNGLNVVSPQVEVGGWRPVDPATADTLHLLALTQAQVTGNKFILFRRSDGQQLVVAMPELKPASPAAPSASNTLAINDDEAFIVGDGLSDVASITYNDREVRFTPEAEGKRLRLMGLKALEATQSTGKKVFVLKYKSPDAKPKEVEFLVFSEKEEVSTPKD